MLTHLRYRKLTISPPKKYYKKQRIFLTITFISFSGALDVKTGVYMCFQFLFMFLNVVISKQKRYHLAPGGEVVSQ